MEADHTEKLLLAECAAEWLIRLETGRPEEQAGFRRWLIESPLHVREALVATTTHLALRHLLHHGRIDSNALMTQAVNVHEMSNHDRGLSRDTPQP